MGAGVQEAQDVEGAAVKDPTHTEAVHHIDLWYPRTGPHTPEEPTSVRIGLVDVRAADDIVIDYDFERDGYRIRMATIHEWSDVEEMEKVGEGLVEVAFVPSWVGDAAEPA